MIWERNKQKSGGDCEGRRVGEREGEGEESEGGGRMERGALMNVFLRIK